VAQFVSGVVPAKWYVWLSAWASKGVFHGESNSGFFQG